MPASPVRAVLSSPRQTSRETLQRAAPIDRMERSKKGPKFLAPPDCPLQGFCLCRKPRQRVNHCLAHLRQNFLGLDVMLVGNRPGIPQSPASPVGL